MPKGSYFLHYFSNLLALLAIQTALATTPRLLVLKDSKALHYVHAICNRNITSYALEAKTLALPASCHMPGQCQHIYNGACLSGLAGTFSSEELDLLLHTCLPSGSLLYHEDDMAVIKAEDQPKFAPAAGQQTRNAHRRSLRQAQPGSNFEEHSAVNGTLINISSISQGQDILLLQEKKQTLAAPLWNLDRIDQSHLPLDSIYSFGNGKSPGVGQGVSIYVLDTGIMPSHQEFQSWSSLEKNNTGRGTSSAASSRATCGHDFVDGSINCEDIDGHGSHVAGTAIGLQVGVAKGASVIAVKILDAQGLGTVGTTIAGLDYVAANARKPAVVTLSLGVQRGQYSRAMEDAVRALVDDHGVMVFAAAGNAAGDSCQFSPGATPQAFTIAASDLSDKYNSYNNDENAMKSIKNEKEGVYSEGNQGACVDLFAPGVDIYSVCGGIRRCGHVSETTYAYASGTSMAVPHVAGAAAIFLEMYPEALPAEVAKALQRVAVGSAIAPMMLRANTINKLLQVKGLEMSHSASVQAADGPTTPSTGKK